MSYCNVCGDDVEIGQDAQLCPPCERVICMSCQEDHEARHEAAEKGERWMRQERQHRADQYRLHAEWVKKNA
jgi:hypothetical protein